MAGEREKVLFTSHSRSKTVNSEFKFFSTSEWNRSSEQLSKSYTSIEISQMFYTLNHSQMTKKLHS